jgi:hypothetical protein
MIRTVESDADYELCARIYAEVEPGDAVTPQRLGYRELPAKLVVEGWPQ